MQVNQRSLSNGWTPLMRLARVAHYRYSSLTIPSLPRLPRRASQSTRVTCAWELGTPVLFTLPSAASLCAHTFAPGCMPTSFTPPAYRMDNCCRNKPYLEMFEYLLQQGADPAITSFPDAHNPNTVGAGRQVLGLFVWVLEVAVLPVALECLGRQCPPMAPLVGGAPAPGSGTAAPGTCRKKQGG